MTSSTVATLSCLKNCYLFPIFCLCTWFFLTLVSHALCLYFMSSQIFPNHVAKISGFEFLPSFPVSLQVPSRLHSTVLINVISIASGRSLMKKLKDVGYRPAELYARCYFFEDGITTFSLSWNPLDTSFIISAPLPQFSFAISQRCSVSMPACKSARPNFSCFFTLLLHWYNVHKAHKVSSHFSWGMGKYILILKNINSFLVLSHQWWTQSFPSSWIYKNVCPAMPESPCLAIWGLWKHATWGKK